MSEALKRAREEATEKLEATTAEFDAMNSRMAELQNGHDKRRADWIAMIEEQRATLYAIDAAIAAETPAKTPGQISIPITANIDAIDQSIAKAMLNRVDLELDSSSIKVSGDSLDVARVVAFLLEQGKDLATGGIATDPETLGVVGEKPGVTVIGSGLMARDEVAGTSDRPIQLGDTVEIRTPIRVVGMSERSTDGHNLGVSKDDGPFCQIEVQGVLTNHIVEILASDLRRCL